MVATIFLLTTNIYSIYSHQPNELRRGADPSVVCNCMQLYAIVTLLQFYHKLEPLLHSEIFFSLNVVRLISVFFPTITKSCHISIMGLRKMHIAESSSTCDVMNSQKIFENWHLGVTYSGIFVQFYLRQMICAGFRWVPVDSRKMKQRQKKI